MFRGGVLLILGVLCSGQNVRGLDCTDKASMQRAQEQCFSQMNLYLGSNLDEIQNVIQKDPEVVCRNPEQYKAALRCAMKVATGCLESVGQSSDILPDITKMQEGMDYLCARLHKIDMQCAQGKQAAMQQCAMSKAMEAFSGTTDFDIKAITCKAFEIALECTHENMNSCSGETEAIYTYFTQHYLTPPACQTDMPKADQGYHFTTAAPMTTFQLVTVVPMLPEVSCYSASSMQEGQKRCFTQEGIDVELPRINTAGGQEAKQSYIDAVLSNNKDVYALCRNGNLPRYQRALSCTMEIGRKCMPVGYKDYLPSAFNMQTMLVDICNHMDDMDQNCVTSKASELFDCGYNKGLENPTRDPKQLLCNAFQWSARCIKEVLPSCGCKTTRSYIRITKEYLNPPACARIMEPVPECHANSDRFVSSAHYGGAASQASVSSVALVLALGLAFMLRL